MNDVADIYELSPIQQGMLFDSLSVQSTGMYLVQLSYVFEGTLDAGAFEAAWSDAVRRHPILRTSFHWEDMAHPLQVVHKRAAIHVERQDWRGHAPERRAELLQSFLDQDRERGMRFGRAPLMRLHLFQMEDRRWQFVWSFHHILMEGWSASIVLGEILAHYRALREGTEFTAPELPPYRNYLSWLQRQDQARMEAAWKEVLAGFREPNDPGIGRYRPTAFEPVTHYDGRRALLTEDETTRLRQFAARHSLTLNTVMQGAWALLLARYSGDDDVAFGSIVSGRSVPLEGIDRIVGLFINILPTRIDLRADETTAEWLQRLQKVQVRMREFEWAPLQRAKACSEVPAGVPLFESLVVFENWQGSVKAEDWRTDLRVTEVVGYQGGPGYPLALVVEPYAAMEYSITYDCDRFEVESIDRALEHLRCILQALPDHGDQAPHSIPVLGETERTQLVERWGAHPVAFPAVAQVQELFEAQARRDPAPIAVQSESGSLTYGELDARANQLAHRLRERGVGPDVVVGVTMRRSPALIVSVLGVLKAGGAYLPLEPDHPLGRRRAMIEDAAAAVLVVGPGGDVPAGFAGEVITIDAAFTALDGAPEGPVERDGDARNLAYVLFTSGSTGRPKGVAIEHRSLVNYTQGSLERFGLTPGDRVLQFASWHFDTAAEETFGALSAGATLVLRDDGMMDSIGAFLRACDERRITVLDLPTAYWHELVEQAERNGPALPASLRLVILGGEKARADRLAAWRRLAPDGPSIVNTYGPTEATIVSTFTDLAGEDTDAVPIGRPVANARCYVLDAAQRLVPTGVPGELCIGGAGLARGYLGRPELTAERFLEDPFAGEPGARLYRTGDRVRWRDDGQLEFLGRIDQQVKVHGQRIEPGEVEAALVRHPDVVEAVVVGREDEPGVTRLVAYHVNRGTASPSVAELRRHLQETLPAAMIPAVFVALPALPLTATGKLDRRALPAPGTARPDLGAAYLEPRSPTEKSLAAIWSELLKVDRVGLRDSFFDLGGDSMKMVQVQDRISRKLSKEVSITDMFQHPTLEELAAFLADETRADTAVEERRSRGAARQESIRARADRRARRTRS